MALKIQNGGNFIVLLVKCRWYRLIEQFDYLSSDTKGVKFSWEITEIYSKQALFFAIVYAVTLLALN